MLLDWQGPALHALSFWLHAPPSAPHHHPVHTLLHTKYCIAVCGYGASANLFFFLSFSPLTAVLWVSSDKDSQKSWYQEGMLAIRTYILNSSPFHYSSTRRKTHTHTHKRTCTYTEHNKEVLILVLSLLYTNFKGTLWGVCHHWLKSSADRGMLLQSCYFKLMKTTQLILNL